jgi:hypothetical protein
MSATCQYVHRKPCCDHHRAAHSIRIVDWWDEEPVGICASCDDGEVDAFLKAEGLPFLYDCIHEWDAGELCGRDEHAPMFPDEPLERIYQHATVLPSVGRTVAP